MLKLHSRAIFSTVPKVFWLHMNKTCISMASVHNLYLYIPSKVEYFSPHTRDWKVHINRVKLTLNLPSPLQMLYKKSIQCMLPPACSPSLHTSQGYTGNLEEKRKSHQSTPKARGGGQRGDWSTEELKIPVVTLSLVRSFTGLISYCEISCKFSQVSLHLSQLAADPWPPPSLKAYCYFKQLFVFTVHTYSWKYKDTNVAIQKLVS